MADYYQQDGVEVAEKPPPRISSLGSVEGMVRTAMKLERLSLIRESWFAAYSNCSND